MSNSLQSGFPRRRRVIVAPGPREPADVVRLRLADQVLVVEDRPTRADRGAVGELSDEQRQIRVDGALVDAGEHQSYP